MPNSARPGLSCDRIVSIKICRIATLKGNKEKSFGTRKFSKRVGRSEDLKRKSFFEDRNSCWREKWVSIRHNFCRLLDKEFLCRA